MIGTVTVLGRRYEFVQDNENWVGGLFAASESTCLGIPGHLITFETRFEHKVAGLYQSTLFNKFSNVYLTAGHD
jgi:hypothetical protein